MKTLPLNKFRTSTKIICGVSLLIVAAVVLLTALSVLQLFHASLILIGLLLCLAAIGYRIHLKSVEQQTRRLTEFNRVHMATVEALATAIDARDQVDIGHVRRTQIYAVRLGELLGLPEDEINALRTGALLHDIGKLAIPDHILSKPDKLTPAELEKTKIHPVVGASILEKVGFDYPVVPTVRHHHERWDGTGYPDGLQGKDIPLTARILCVADAYDTLRGARPYRPAIPRDQSRQIILEGSGGRFDPTIVQTLIKNLVFLEAEVNEQGHAYPDPSAEYMPVAKPQDQHFAEQIKLANREVFNLYELAREFSGSVTLFQTLQMFAKKVGEFVPYDTCILYLLDEGKQSASAAHVEGNNADVLSLRRIKVGQGATGFALKSSETVINAEPDLDFSYSQTELLEQYSTMAAVPLIADGELLGAVTIYSHELAAYGEEHIRLLETISRIASDAIGKSLLHDEATTHAMTDPMTGLPNARSLQLQFEREAGRASRSDTGFQLLMLDLDGFKLVNDTFGHKVGDELLREVGQVILGQLRDYDFLARYGGDEFVAIVPNAEPEDVADLCERIERAVGDFRLPVGEKGDARVGVSLGSAGYPQAGATFDQIVVAADKAMYTRKISRKRLLAITNASGRPTDAAPPDKISSGNLIVELDESHVLASRSIN
ncbi:MAG: diguanylate cyclase [Chloracidobacterium sp.]|nr:diguanylate cyclase [Chloracidobacterium sp.]